MSSSRSKSERGGGSVGGGGGLRYHHNQSNRGRRDAPQRCSPRVNRPPVHGNRPPPLHAPETPEQGQLGVSSANERAGGAWGPSMQPPPHPENHVVQFSRACNRTWRASCFPFPFAFPFSIEWRPRLFISFSCSLGGD